MRIEGFEEAEKLFKRLEDSKISLKAVDKAAPILLKAAKASLHQAIHNPPTPRKGESNITGALEKSVISHKAKHNSYGAYSTIEPVGKDTTKKPSINYAGRAAILEWGTSKGLAPSPWRARAIKNAEAQCQKAMESTYLEEVDKIWKVEEL